MRSLERTLSILECAAAWENGVTIAEIAKATGLPISTASRLVHTLMGLDLLSLNDSQRYMIGNRILTLARRGIDQNPLFMRARPHMLELRDLTGETVSLHVPFEDNRVCIGEARSHHPIRRVLPPGEVKPLIGTASGEVLLIDVPPDELPSVLAARGVPKKEIPEVVERVRKLARQGWAFVDTWVDGVAALSAPIRSEGLIVASLTVSGPSSRYDHDTAMEHLPQVLDVAEQISGELGGRSLAESRVGS